MRYWSGLYWQDRYWPLTYWSQGSYAGSVASTLEDVSAAFVGSASTPTLTGSIAVTLGDATSAFTGSAISLGNYWAENYWYGQYWSASYWQDHEPSSATGTIAVTLDAATSAFTGTFALSASLGSYWPEFYWAPHLWAANYWQNAEPGVATGTLASTLGDATASLAGTSSLSGTVTGVLGPTLEDATSAFTGSIAQTEYVDLSILVGIGWQITVSDVFTGSIAVTLADATSALAGVVLPPDSATGSVHATLQNATSAFTGTATAPAGAVGVLNVTLADVTAAFTGLAAAIVRSGTISSTLEDAQAAFRGQQLLTNTVGQLTTSLEDVTATIRGFVLDGYADVGYIQLTLEDASTQFVGAFIPIPIVIDLGPQNPEAVYIPSNYEICDRTGFRLPAGTLIEEWTGARVRRQSWEPRHMQDFVRGRPEKHTGSVRPEGPDEFIEEEVTADEL